MKQEFTIPGRLDGANESRNDDRWNKYRGANAKRSNQAIVAAEIRRAHLKPMKCPISIHVTWIEGLKPGCKKFYPRDKDNIRAGIKYIQDALVECGIIKDDGFRFVTPSDDYLLNRNNPRIVVTLEEI